MKNNLGDDFVEVFKKFPPFKKEYGAYSEKAIKKFLDKFADRLPKQPEPLLNADGSQVVDDQGHLVFKTTE